MFKKLKKILGWSLILGSIAVGLYAGIWLCFIGGIIQVINGITPVINNGEIIIGIVKIISAEIIGLVAFVISAFIGALLLQ